MTLSEGSPLCAVSTQPCEVKTQTARPIVPYVLLKAFRTMEPLYPGGEILISS